MSDKYDDLVTQFGEPISKMSGDLLEFEDVTHFAATSVWTIVEGENDTMWAMAGFHVVNRLGYILTPKPWITGQEQFRWDD